MSFTSQECLWIWVQYAFPVYGKPFAYHACFGRKLCSIEEMKSFPMILSCSQMFFYVPKRWLVQKIDLSVYHARFILRYSNQWPFYNKVTTLNEFVPLDQLNEHDLIRFVEQDQC